MNSRSTSVHSARRWPTPAAAVAAGGKPDDVDSLSRAAADVAPAKAGCGSKSIAAAAADAETPDPEEMPPARRPIARLPWLALLLAVAPAAVVHLSWGFYLSRQPGVGTLAWVIPAALGVIALAGVACLAYRRGWRMARRLENLASALQRMQDGEYRARASLRVADEIGMLSHRVNRLAASAAERERRIIEHALIDPLTGLHNRTILTDRIRAAISVAQRNKSQFAVTVIDLDRFKFVNDTLGHSVGDLLLKEVAKRLKDAVRETDTVARLGGDEFVLLLSGGLDAAREVTNRIVARMAAPLRKGGQLIDIGASLGIAVYPDHGTDDSTLLRHADAAMYRAKQQRLGVCVFDGEGREVRRSYLSMLGEMRTALNEKQFRLDYQPQLDLKTGLIVGLEGLVRWDHPTRGRIPPNEFIPFAEQTGFMREMTRWVVAEGLRFATTLREQGLDLCVSVNVAAQDLENPEFFQVVQAALSANPMKPRGFCLEITESGLVTETEIALGNLRALADAGVKLSVDDFGTGYATLKQLQGLPVNELKIDRSFVSGLHSSRGNESIVRATIDLAKRLGLSVVAEGVETIRELRVLASMGCDEVQGYYLSKPMPAEEVAAWVEMRHSLHASSRENYFALLTSS